MKYCLSLVFLIYVSLVFSQDLPNNLDLTWGPTQYHESNDGKLLDVLSIGGEIIYTLYYTNPTMIKDNGFYLEKLDKDFNYIEGLDLIKASNNSPILEYLVERDKVFYLFTSKVNNQEQSATLSLQSIEKESFTFSESKTKLTEIDYDKSLYIGVKDQYKHFSFDTSIDTSKIVIRSDIPGKKRVKESMEFIVLNKEMEQLWSYKAELPYDSYLFDVVDLKINNAGRVYLLGKIYNDVKKDLVGNTLNYRYEIFVFEEESSAYKKIQFKHSGKLLYDLQFADFEDSTMVCAGFYSSINLKSTDGSYCMKINPRDNTKESEVFNEFGLDLLLKNETAAYAKKLTKRVKAGKNEELPRYKLDEIVIKDDGGIVYIGEEFLSIQELGEVNYRPADVSGPARNFLKDILVVSTSKNGNIIWSQRIAKDQYTLIPNHQFGSYHLSVFGNKLYFLFNDNKNNFDSDQVVPERYTPGPKNSYIAVVEINEHGEISKHKTSSSKEVNVFLSPSESHQVTKRETILYGNSMYNPLKKRSYRFSRLTFE